ncbi:hypothetical protein [Halomonas sp. PGE1]|uniref:hypothetical protein n=1 Tax=Halomonas sp. PGE1 TaxID=2730360 RepID=UPI0014736AB1|nr:hypothetical protein [Halomonas sp. PGE1]QJQ97446.1 hypothetical protein HIR79_01170 [Halomonas sp. PGE1]
MKLRLDHKAIKLATIAVLASGFPLMSLTSVAMAGDDLSGNAELSVASDNALFIQQARIEQIGSNNAARTYQVGSYNSSSILQIGSGNQGSISQLGSGHDAGILQAGGYLEARITQQGYGHSGNIVQKGFGKEASITQHGVYGNANIQQLSTSRAPPVSVTQISRGSASVQVIQR